MRSPHKLKLPGHLPPCSGSFLLLELSFNLFDFFILDPNNLDICSFSNIYFIFNYVCVCVCVLVQCQCLWRLEESDLPRTVVTDSLRCPTWTLGTELKSCEEWDFVLNSEHLSFSEHLLFSHCSKAVKMLVPEPAWR